MNKVFTAVLLTGVLVLQACQDNVEFHSRVEEIFPPVEMKYAALYRMDNLPVSPAFFNDHWTLVIFGAHSCSESCMKRLQLIHQVEAAQKLFVFDGLADPTQLRALASRFPSVAITMGTTASSFDNFSAQFNVDVVSAADKYGYIYLVNPAAQLVYVLTQKGMTSADINLELEHLE